MGNIISTELLKIKRYSVVKAGLVMMSLSVLMSCFYLTASTNKVWDFQYFIQQVIISNCTLFFPIIITLVAVYIISRETTDDTLKSILTVPISYKKLLIAKFWLLLFLTIVFSIFIKIILTDLNDVKVEKPKKDINELCISRSDNEHGQKEYKKNAILKILHTLEQKAFYGDDGQDINWIGITSIGNSENSSWNIQPLGVYLYEGLGGIALFYNALQQSDFDVDLSAACKAFETMMFQYTDDMLERSTDLEKESSGAYAGEASVIYVYEVLYKITGKQKYLEYAEKHCKILEYALKADENNDLIYGNAGAVIVLLNLYHLAQKDIYLQLACEAGNILIKNQNKGKWCCGNGQSLSGLSHGITGIIYALTKLNNEQFHIEYQKAIHSGLIYENTMYSDKYNNWLDNREEAKKEENSDNRCMAAWCHGAPGILLARSKMYNLVKDSSDYITVQCDIERALFATKMYGFTDNDCLCHGNLGNTEILLEYSKECNDEEVRHMMLSARTQIAMDIINENYDCARSYLHGYKIPGFMTGISGMGYSLLRDLYPELPCILALEI